MNDPDFVNSLARGLAVLSCFGKGHEKMTLTEVAQRTDLTRGTARRFLLTLCKLGYVTTDEKNYWLTHKVLKFSSNYLATFGLGEAAYSHIQELTETLGETSSMAVLDESEIVYVARVEKYRIFSNRIEIGTRLPAHSTSLGLALLSGYTEAELDGWLARHELVKFTANTTVDKRKLKKLVQTVRSDGYAMTDGTLETGVRSLSVPIFDKQSAVIAAINVVSFSGRMTGEAMVKDYLPALLEKAKKIGYALAQD